MTTSIEKGIAGEHNQSNFIILLMKKTSVTYFHGFVIATKIPYAITFA